jgi:fused signal recognition particle receptor
LVLDATTGQNAISQAKLFGEVVGVTGIALAKLDGSAKGGVVIAVKQTLDIPVKMIGIGEGIEDLRPFNSGEFVDALFAQDS